MSKNYYDEDEDEIDLYSPINDDNTSSISSDNNKDLSILELGSNVKKYFRFPNNSNDISVTVSKIKDPETDTIISEGKNEPLDKDIKNEKTKKPIIKGKPKAFKIEFKHGVNLEKMMDIEESNGDFVFSSVEIDADYFKLNKKTINNYDNRQNMTITDNTNLTNNNSSLKKNFFGKIYNNGNQTRPQKRLSKNSSQGNILGPNNYNINLGSNGINHVYKNVNENYNYKNYHSNCNTNLITPIKYINQKSNFKAENIQLTQIRPPNNYNLYNETFQSFGTNLTTLTNNQDLKSQRNNNYNENNNYFEMKTRQENIKEISKNNDYEYNNKNTNYDFNKFKELYRQNLNNETERRQPKLQEKNGNCNNVYNTYIPATINNIGNKTYSYFNNIQKNNKINENEKNENEKSNNFNDIDFNDLDQFSPPYHSNQFDLNKNIDKNFTIENKYMNLGCIEERNKNYETVNYDCNFGNNRKVIDDFIKQLKTNI